MRNINRKLGLLIAVSIFAVTASVAQDPDEVLLIDTQLVDVPVSVTDSSGKPVLKLKQENFVVYEDGKQQEIASFFATEAPFEVALFLDTSGSTRAELELVKRAAKLFIDSLRPGDRVAIIAFTTGLEKDTGSGHSRTYPDVDILTTLTDDRSKLDNAVGRVGVSNGTPFYDGLVDIMKYVFKDAPAQQFRGRRALVALTDGVDSTSDADYDQASEVISAAGIKTYFVNIDTRMEFEDALLGDCGSSTQFSRAQLKRYYDLFPREYKIERVLDFCKLGDFERLDISKRLYTLATDEMEVMANASGGKVFPVGDLNEAKEAFEKVAADIGTSYSIGYYSTNTNFDGTFRKITVEAKGLPEGSILRTRDGYTAPKRK